MDWFRSWHGAPTDVKWLVIAKRAQVAPGMVSALVWALLDYASQNDDRGSIANFDVETYAIYTGWDEEQIDAILAAMRDKELITDDNRLASWEKHQPKREDDSSNRVKAFRERKHQQAALQAEQAALHDGCNAMKRTVTQRNATEKNREDTETEQRLSTESTPHMRNAGDAASKPAPDGHRPASNGHASGSVDPSLFLSVIGFKNPQTFLRDVDETLLRQWAFYYNCLNDAQRRAVRSWPALVNDAVRNNRPPRLNGDQKARFYREWAGP
jgi:hypothetical protein